MEIPKKVNMRGKADKSRMEYLPTEESDTASHWRRRG